MKVRFLVLINIFFIAIFANIFAQGMGVNTSGAEADASAILDVSSTTQGLLIPRMTNTQRLAISSPATGLIIFQTDGSVGIYYYDGTFWTYISAQSVGAPTLTTTNISSITSSSASSGGNVTSDGGSSVTARGVCWSTSSSPTTADSKTSDGSGTGSFTSSITGLSIATTYYVRAYATNSEGTVYGSEENFNTSAEAPTLSTTSASSIFSTSASSGGNITDNGGASITAKGVVWGTSSSPTTGSNIGSTSDGTGTGSFTSSITGLTLGNTYYVRAYATNSIGTSYGDEISFTTALAVGESYQGGIIFYVDGSGGGLIAAESDQSTGTSWFNGSQVNVGSTSSAIGTGQANTTTIVSALGSGSYAAQICDDLVLNGYSDWYLPSRDELSTLYSQKNKVGGFTSTLYFASYQLSANNNASTVSFSTGGLSYTTHQYSAGHVRAIRSF